MLPESCMHMVSLFPIEKERLFQVSGGGGLQFGMKARK